MAACSLFTTAKASIADLEDVTFQEIVGGNQIKLQNKTPSFFYNAYAFFNGYRLFVSLDNMVNAHYFLNENGQPCFKMSDVHSNYLGQIISNGLTGRLPKNYELFNANEKRIASIHLIEDENSAFWQGTDPITGEIVFQITCTTTVSQWVLSYINVDYFEEQQIDEFFLLTVMGILASPINVFGLIQ